MSKQIARVVETIEGEYIGGDELDDDRDFGSGDESYAQRQKPKSTATVLVNMALDRYEFGVSKTGETFAIPREGDPVVSLLKGSKTAIRSILSREYFREHRKAASQQALGDAMAVIEGFAQETDERELHLRVAENSEGLWLDVGDLTGQAVLIARAGWKVIDRPPMLFKRTVLNGSLPVPDDEGDLDTLWTLLNVTEGDRPILLAALVAMLFPSIPHPVITFLGEAGTGKTTGQKIIVSVVDPGPVPVRKPPRDPDSWVTAAAGSWVVALDNVSEVRPWLSDSICRAVTGDGDVRRKLYTDGDHAIFAFRRCICLNGIDLGATRGDLGERMLPIVLERIPDSKRLTEDEIWPTWKRSHARILGGLLDLAVRVLESLPSVELESKPRMADFARILRAVDIVLGTDGLANYVAKQSSLAADALAGDPFSATLASMTEPFVGTSADLLAKFTKDKPPRDWPKNARTVTTLVRRAAPSLIKLGYTVDDDGARNHDGVLRWTLSPPERARNNPPQPPQARTGGDARGDAGMGGVEYRTSRVAGAEL
ncbi:MAG: ATP-binding protein [Woeseiaceae bacterium]|nr:ATP-binding protein [Woeseiaceae bacterium]